MDFNSKIESSGQRPVVRPPRAYFTHRCTTAWAGCSKLKLCTHKASKCSRKLLAPGKASTPVHCLSHTPQCPVRPPARTGKGPQLCFAQTAPMCRSKPKAHLLFPWENVRNSGSPCDQKATSRSPRQAFRRHACQAHRCKELGVDSEWITLPQILVETAAILALVPNPASHA